MHKWFDWPRMLWLSPLPLATAASVAGIWRSATRLQDGRSRREWLPFVLSVFVFVFAFAGLAYSLFPYLVVDRMTLWQAAAAPESLLIMLVGAAVTLPMILGYTIYVYRVFWGRSAALSYE